MAEALVVVAQDLYRMMGLLDRLRGDGVTVPPALVEAAQDLQPRIQAARDQVASGAEAVRHALDALHRHLAVLVATVSQHPTAERLGRVRAQMADAYERLLKALREDTHLRDLGAQLRSLRPRNGTRAAFHISMGVMSALLYELVLDRRGALITLGVIVGTWVAIDVSRRVWPRLNELLFDGLLRRITRPRERHSVPAATWYAVGLLVAVLIGDRDTAQIAALVVGVGDPAAAFVGRRFGRRKIWRRKSWAGSLGFILVSMAVVCTFLLVTRPYGLLRVLQLAAVGGVAGAVAEVLSDDTVDDNLSIPVAVTLALILLG